MITSSNQVIKDAVIRDTVSKELGRVLCFEMEAAGLINDFPYLVIWGVCNYIDFYKYKMWQPYIAVMAAIYTKEILLVILAGKVTTIRPTDKAIGGRFTCT